MFSSIPFLSLLTRHSQNEARQWRLGDFAAVHDLLQVLVRRDASALPMGTVDEWGGQYKCYLCIYTLVKSNVGQKKIKKLSRYVSVRDFPLNSANIAAEILHVHGVILILT